ncbi:MAG TPA: glycosyltransferase family 9 protein [Planctomycetota bacterium]|jgi:ADP-heptose:LPS heptosyltransferase|nr:glycosyltransferase family 9 protein [Planctomycetota bacterium]
MDRAPVRPSDRAILGVGRPPSTAPGAILAVRPGGLGDTIFAFPALRALRFAFPRARIAAAGNAGFLSLARVSGFADEVVSADAAWFGTLLSDEVPLAPEVRSFLAGFGLVLSFGFDDPVFVRRAKEAGARDVLAFPSLPPPGTRRAVPAFLLDALRAIGVRRGDVAPRVVVPPEDLQAARAQLRGRTPVLAVHPGSGSSRKNWDAAGFAEVGRRWGEGRGRGVLLLSGYADAKAREGFLRAFGPADFLLEARDRPIVEVAALLAASSVYLGNDSGVTHLAAAVGVPVLALFGRASPAMFRPAGERVRVFRSRALERLGPSTVWRALGPLLLGRTRR